MVNTLYSTSYLVAITIEVTQTGATGELRSETRAIETNDCSRASATSRFASGFLFLYYRYNFLQRCIVSSDIRRFNGHSLYLDLLPEALARRWGFAQIILGT